MKVTRKLSLRNASAAHQKVVDVLLFRILQLGKYYFSSSQRLGEAGQGPNALKELRGWMDHSSTGSNVTHEVTATYNISTSGNEKRAGKTNFHLKPSSQTHV